MAKLVQKVENLGACHVCFEARSTLYRKNAKGYDGHQISRELTSSLRLQFLSLLEDCSVESGGVIVCWYCEAKHHQIMAQMAWPRFVLGSWNGMRRSLLL